MTHVDRKGERDDRSGRRRPGLLMEDDVAHHCPVPRRRDQGGVAGGGPDGGSQGPEMEAEQMPPRGRSNPDCPKGHGELVVQGTIAAT
jgi:hypothetical protein